MKFRLLLLFVTLSHIISAQSVTVPSKMEFAGIKIHFNSSAKKRVQHEVDKIRKSPTYFQKHVDQANLYFPLIEEVFKKKNFPLDFKYLIIQESAFNADAVHHVFKGRTIIFDRIDVKRCTTVWPETGERRTTIKFDDVE